MSLAQFQKNVADRLAADDFFNDIQIIYVRPRSEAEATMIATKLNNALMGLVKKNGKAGVAVEVQMPTIDVPNQQLPGPRQLNHVVARVYENPMINMGASGTFKVAEDIVDHILQLHHSWFMQDTGGTVVASQDAARPVEEFLAKGIVAYDVKFETQRGLQPANKVAMPTISGTPDAVTISGPGTKYYTIDGSYPSCLTEEGITAVLYAEPFAVTAGTRVLSVSYNPNQQASDLAAKLIN